MLGERMLPEVKPDEEMLGERMLLKPCDTISKRSIGDTQTFLKPCDSVSENLTKKRRVDVDKMNLEEERPRITVEEGQPLDIIALLSSKHRDYLVSPKHADARVPISTLHAKYVLVCCFSLPLHCPSRVASEFRAIQALYSDLSRRGIANDFKFVIVINRCAGFAEADWRTFFSTTPLTCLTVPLSDSHSLHYLCNSLYNYPNAPSYVHLPHLLLNPSGVVLKRSRDFLLEYGPLSFPFTKDHFRTVDLEDEYLKHQLYFSNERITLDDLFPCRNWAEIGSEMNVKSTKELGKATVGLYLYFDGKFMDRLQDIHKKCVEKGLGFNIVLVPMPFHTESDPVSFYDVMKQHALKYSTSSSWLAFPFDDKICRTFWRIFMCREEDQLIILQHDNSTKSHGELFGKQIASSYGVDAYPFSRAVVVERKVSELRSFTVESLFEESERYIKKNVLVQIDYPGNNSGTDLKYTLEKYPELQAEYPDIEGVFVPLLTDEASGQPVLAPDAEHFGSRIFMRKTYLEEPVRPLLVVFGKHGKIVSRHEEGKLRGSVTPANLFIDTLQSEILAYMRKQIEYESQRCKVDI